MDTLEVGPYPVIAGDSFALQLTVKDRIGGTPQNMSGWTFTAQWRTRAGSATAVPFTVDQSSAATGLIIISLSPAQTRAMGGSGTFDVQGTTDAGATVRTFARGTTTYLPDVTRA